MQDSSFEQILYQEYYGLDKSPFINTPDPNFYFESLDHHQALLMLHFGVTQRRGFITLTGEIGSGKTTLCRIFFNNLAKAVRTAYIFNPHFSETGLLQLILKDFGVKTASSEKEELYMTLNHFLIQRAKHGENACLVIDEAQGLSPMLLEQIRLLSNLETETMKLLQIVLVGQPELHVTLRDPRLKQLQQRIAVKYHLSGLQKEEIIPYFMTRMQSASGRKPLRLHVDQNVAEEVYLFSAGIPRLINFYFDSLLMAAFAKKILHVDRAFAALLRTELENSLNSVQSDKVSGVHA